MAVWKEMKKYSLQCTKAHNDLGGESQCGGIQIHRCPRIFLRGGVYLYITKLLLKSAFWVLYVVFYALIIAYNFLFIAKCLFLLHNHNNITSIMRLYHYLA